MTLACDIEFFRHMDIDMIGMGPYVVHHNTPIGKHVLAAGGDSKEAQNQRFILGLNMIAVTRLYLKNVNIAATTALQALNPFGTGTGAFGRSQYPHAACNAAEVPPSVSALRQQTLR